MKKIYLVTIFMILNVVNLFAQYANAQGNMDGRIPGRPFVPEASKNIDGSPYLYKDFSKGSLLLDDNKTIVNNLQIKFNVFRGTLTYNDENGIEMVPNNPIRRFTIENNGKISIFQSGFPAIDKWDSNTYYEVLNQGGETFILKKLSKTLISKKEYNSAKVTDSYLDDVKYYVFTKSKELVKFKTDKKSFASYFGDKEVALMDYVRENKISLKTDADLGRLFDYYNSLK